MILKKKEVWFFIKNKMDNFFKRLLKYKNRIALVDKNSSINYFDLLNKSFEIQNLIASNSLVLMISSNKLNFVIGYIAFLSKKKTISILLDESLDKKFIKKISLIYKPNYIFLPIELKKYFTENKIIFQNSDYLILKFSDTNNKNLNYKNFLLLTTSGTTHSPKLVRFSKKNLLSNIYQIIDALNITQKHYVITTMPLGYSYGLSILNTHLFSGAKIYLNDKTIFQKEFWNSINLKKINSFNGVPEFFEFLKKIKFEKILPKSLKYITQAGGKLNLDILSYFGNICKKNNVKFHIMYGQTEASPRIAILNWKNFFSGYGSVGKPLKGTRIILQKKNGKKVSKDGKKGEIIFFGKNACLGYATNLNDLKKGDENKGKIKTGDIGMYDNLGNLFIVGRNDKQVKIFGKRCNLTDLENYLKDRNLDVKCFFNKPFLIARTSLFTKKDIIRKIISNFLNLNKNFILIKKNEISNFKNYNKQSLKQSND